MDIIAKNQILIRLVMALIALNLVVLVVFWRQNAGRADDEPSTNGRKAEALAVLRDRLHLSQEQVTALQALRNDFSEKEAVLSKAIKAARDSMNVEMFQENTDTGLVKSLARHVAENEYQMELYRWRQAEQFKDICKPEQLRQFEDMVIEIRDYFKPDKKKKGKSPE